MITEGIGIKAPSPTIVSLTDHDMSCLLQTAKERATHRGYKARASIWQQGLKQDVVLEGAGLLARDVRPIFCGLAGEYATSWLINRRYANATRVDTRLLKRGDFGIDLTAFGVTLQCKTRQSADHGNLIRRVNEQGYTLSMPAHAFVFCEWRGSRNVFVLGWAVKRELERKATEPSHVGSWQNIVVDDTELRPFSALLDELAVRKEQRVWR